MFVPILSTEEALVRIALFWMKMDNLGLCRPYNHVAQLCVESALARGDQKSAETLVVDNQPRCNVKQISRFVPGRHYYALDRKFLTYDLAVTYLRDRGYTVHPEVFEYRILREGD